MGITEVFERLWYSGDDILDRETLPNEDLQRCLTEVEHELLDGSRVQNAPARLL